MTRAPGSIKAAFAALMLHIRIVDGSGSCDKNIKAAPLRNKLVDLLLKKSPGKPRPKNKRFKKKKKRRQDFRAYSNFEFHFSNTPQQLKPRAAGIFQYSSMQGTASSQGDGNTALDGKHCVYHKGNWDASSQFSGCG